MYEPKTGLTKKISNFYNNYLYDKSHPPKNNDEYQLTTEAAFNRIAQHERNTFDKYRFSISSLFRELNELESDIAYKEKNLFYPNSNSYDANTRENAKQQRAAALQKISTGKINTTGLLKEIEENFRNKNTDINSEYYNYLLSHDLAGVSMTDQLNVITTLKKGFGIDKLNQIKEMKSDLKTAKEEYRTLETTFKIN